MAKETAPKNIAVSVRKDGKFVLPELECLNPENLV